MELSEEKAKKLTELLEKGGEEIKSVLLNLTFSYVSYGYSTDIAVRIINLFYPDITIQEWMIYVKNYLVKHIRIQFNFTSNSAWKKFVPKLRRSFIPRKAKISEKSATENFNKAIKCLKEFLSWSSSNWEQLQEQIEIGLYQCPYYNHEIDGIASAKDRGTINYLLDLDISDGIFNNSIPVAYAAVMDNSNVYRDIAAVLKELTRSCPQIGFYGYVSDHYQRDERERQIYFNHIPETHKLWWCEINKDSIESRPYNLLLTLSFSNDKNTVKWMWDAITNETKYLSNDSPIPYTFVLDKVPLSFPIIIPIEGTGYCDRNKRIENVQEGDKLILKADWESKYYWPVAIEVFDSNGGSLGLLRSNFLRNHIDYNWTMNALAKLAEQIDNLEAIVADVTPLSKRHGNAKYALLDVGIDIKIK